MVLMREQDTMHLKMVGNLMYKNPVVKTSMCCVVILPFQARNEPVALLFGCVFDVVATFTMYVWLDTNSSICKLVTF